MFVSRIAFGMRIIIPGVRNDRTALKWHQSTIGERTAFRRRPEDGRFARGAGIGKSCITCREFVGCYTSFINIPGLDCSCGAVRKSTPFFRRRVRGAIGRPSDTEWYCSPTSVKASLKKRRTYWITLPKWESGLTFFLGNPSFVLRSFLLELQLMLEFSTLGFSTQCALGLRIFRGLNALVCCFFL